MKTMIAVIALLAVCSIAYADVVETIQVVTRAVNCVTFRGASSCM